MLTVHNAQIARLALGLVVLSSALAFANSVSGAVEDQEATGGSTAGSAGAPEGGDGVEAAGGASGAPRVPTPPTEVAIVSAAVRGELINTLSDTCETFRGLRKDELAQLSDAEVKAARDLCDSTKSGNGLADPLLQAEYFERKAEGIGVDHSLERVRVDRGPAVVDQILHARCKAAICFGERMQVGIEPLVELPVGKSFSANRGPLADYVNNHDIKIDLAAGVRVWAFRDMVSLSIYLSKPLSDRSVRLPGSAFDYPPSALRRPYPGLALGLLYDTIWLGLDRDELRNTDSTSGVAHDPAYPPNGIIGASWTLTLALQPVTAFRTSIGAAVNNTKAFAK